MHLHLNPIGGLAGDMFCAALLDLRPDLLDPVRRAVAGLGMPIAVRIELQAAEGPLHGRRFKVSREVYRGGHGHHHTGYADIRRMLDAARLDPGVRRRALDVFALLAEAEGRVHGIEPDAVQFHEVGAWDSIADVVAAAVLLEALEVSGASCDPLPLGGGRVHTEHGWLPVPAPATALLLEGLPVVDDGVGGERVTPTGAAILRALRPAAERAAGVVSGTGTGFGTRVLDGLPNCVQILAIDAVPHGSDFRPARDRVGVIRFDVDDQSPEDFAVAMDRLRAQPGVLSVTSIPGSGKRGRPLMAVEILLRPGQLETVVEACFRETPTIGLRWQQSERFVLAREQRRVRVGDRELQVKLVRRPQGWDAKAESGDLESADGCSRRRRLAEAAVREALQEFQCDD